MPGASVAERDVIPKVARIPNWRALVRPYERQSNARAAVQLFVTWVPLAALFWGMDRALRTSTWIALALTLPAAGLLVRTFIVMHDCAHGSFFSSRRANAIVGWFAGVVTLTPFAQWRRDHAKHHASSGDLDRRGHGDVKTLTVREFRALPRRGRFAYRLMRHPAVLFGLGPLHLIVSQRVTPPGTPLFDSETRSVWSTNLGIAGILAVAAWLVGWRAAMLIYGPSIYIAAAVGLWLFYVQHQFEHAYWEPHTGWDHVTASLRGSSYLKLPRVLRWFTADIGVHHVHHLSPRIPNYQLCRCHEENSVFHDVTTLTIADTFATLRLSLWDEDRRRLVSFESASPIDSNSAPADPQGYS